MIVTSVVVSIILLAIIGVAWVSKSALERFLYYFAGYFMNADVQSRINLIAPTSKDTLVTRDGDLVTYFRIRGARRLIGPKDFDAMAEKLNDIMRISMSDGSGKQHVFSVGYLSDPAGTRHEIRNLMQAGITTARRMGASKNAKVWFEEREDFLS